MLRSFPKALKWCMIHGDMTVSDLAVWFDRPRSTVNTWVNGSTPYGPAGRLAFYALGVLQLRIKQKKVLPVPATLSWLKRADYIRGVRDAAGRNSRVPQVRTAG